MGRPAQFATVAIAMTVIAIAAFQCGCSSPRSRRILSALFDGVPARTVAPPDSADTRKARTQTGRPATRDSVAAAFVLHSPFEDRECDGCHNLPDRSTRAAGRSGMPSFNDGAHGASRLILPRDELCFECHDDLSAEYAEENELMIHSPVEDGECLECHQPHRSRNAYLLRAKPVKTLCFGCHDDTIPEGEYGHPVLDDNEKCTDCHEPHLSKNEFLLKRK